MQTSNAGERRLSALFEGRLAWRYAFEARRPPAETDRAYCSMIDSSTDSPKWRAVAS